MIRDLFRADLESFKPYEAESCSLPIKLDANESFLAFPRELEEELMSRVKKSLFNRYPDPSSKEVCKSFAQYSGIKEDQVIAGNGSDELIQIIVNAFITKKEDKVMTLSPSFSMYSIYTKIAGGTTCYFVLDENFNLDYKRLIHKVKEEKIKLLFIANPNNPTGSVIEKEVLKEIIKNCNCIVVIDEAYYEFYGSTTIDLIEEYKNLIVLRTCSKAIGLAALRLGFLASNIELMEELKKTKPPFNVNSITQSIGQLVLKEVSLIKRNIEAVLIEREILLDALENVKGVKVYKTETNFMLLESDKAAQIKERALKMGINLRSFEGRLKNFLRVTVGSREENKAFLSCLKEEV